jgi:hypothetical protein
VTPDGSLYQWDGQGDLSTSTLITVVPASVHDDPTILFNA